MSRLRIPRTLIFSLVLHSGLLAGGELTLRLSLSEALVTHAPRTVIELTDDLETSALGEAKAMKLPSLGGSVATAHPDLERAGRGGDGRVLVPAINLSVTVEDVTLERAELNHLEQRQQYHSDVASRRAGALASAQATITGDAAHRQSGRQRSHRLATSGEARSPFASHRAGDVRPLEHAGRGAALGRIGDRGDSARRSTAGAEVGLPPVAAFPMLDEGTDAPGTAAPGPASDRITASQQVANHERSLLDASTAGGEPSLGRGGMLGEGRPAAGGERGTGSKATSNGLGPGNGVGIDDHLLGYVRAIRSRVQWDDAFPVWAITEGRGGIAILDLTIAADGSLQELAVLRSSGIGEFDRNLLAAVRRAAPFGAIPARLSRSSLRLRFSFDATNPVVGRQGPGPGSRASR